MFVLHPLPRQLDPARVELFVKAEPATIGHFLHTGFMDPAIRALFSKARVAGTAVPIRVPGLDGTIVHYALGQVRPGDILVMDRCGDHRHATVGGVVAYAARRAGVAAIVVDGMVTDLSELAEYGVPVWARGTSPVTTKRLGLAGDFCVPVSCGGVTVHPGDAILADENGVLCLGPTEMEAAAQRAMAMQQAEKNTLARLEAGEKLPDITGATALIQAKLPKA